MDSERRSAKTRRGMTPDGRVALVAGDTVDDVHCTDCTVG